MIYDFLQKCAIKYEKYDHAAVFTCAESNKIAIEIPGAHTKQLLMRDKKKRHYVLAIVMHDKNCKRQVINLRL